MDELFPLLVRQVRNGPLTSNFFTAILKHTYVFMCAEKQGSKHKNIKLTQLRCGRVYSYQLQQQFPFQISV